MVTSQKVSEKKVGNRGSKTVIFPNTAVKEQRVDDSWCTNLVHLKYTLMGFERNYLAKIPSDQVIQRRSYSSIIKSTQSSVALNPWLITGFIDAEGSFMVRIRKSHMYATGWHVVALFSVTLDKKDLYILQALKAYFGGGSIWKDGQSTFKFRIESLELIMKVIIPHFDQYPLITQKLGDYLLFRAVVELMKYKEHLTMEGLHKIASIKATLNRGLSDELKVAFPVLNPLARPLVEIPKIIPEEWISGFTSGEGCFKVTLKKSLTTKVGFKVLLVFQITQHSRDEMLMESLISYFGCGILEKDPRGPCVNFSVYSFADNYEKIIPFFNLHNLIGIKSENFKDWCKVGEIIKVKNHLTPKGLEEIREIKSGMNKGRSS